MTPHLKARMEELAEDHGREYFKRKDLPGPGSTHDQIFEEGFTACYEEMRKELDRYKKALDLALYYIEGDAAWESVKAKVEEILKNG